MARKAGLTRDRILDVACEIADRDGIDAVGLSSVANVVGVRPPSLYAHVEGLAGLRRGITLRATEQLAEVFRTAAAQHDDPRAALCAIAVAYRRFARAHPGLYAALLPVPSLDDDPEGAAAAFAPMRTLAEILDRWGVAGRHLDFIRTLRALLHGFVDLELRGGFDLDAPVEPSFTAALERLLDSFDPAFAAAPALTPAGVPAATHARPALHTS